MKGFFKTIANSITSKEFYGKILRKETSAGFGYIFWLNVILAFILITPIAFSIQHFYTQEQQEKFVAYFPQDLVITVASSTISTNQAEPYFLFNYESIFGTDKESVKKSSSDYRGRLKDEHLVVFDTRHPFSLEKFEELKSTVLISQDALVTRKDNGQIQIMALKEFGDINTVITQESFRQFILWSKKFVVLLPIIGFFVLVLFGFLSTLFFSLFYALIIWAVLRVTQKSPKQVQEMNQNNIEDVQTSQSAQVNHSPAITLSFDLMYRVALYASTITLVTHILSLVGLSFFSAPFVPTILVVVLAVFFIKKSGAELSVEKHKISSN